MNKISFFFHVPLVQNQFSELLHVFLSNCIFGMIDVSTINNQWSSSVPMKPLLLAR